MPTPSDYKERRLERRDQRRARAQRLRKWVPVLMALCRKNSIDAREISGGYQFRIREYIVNWWPSSNRITIQYAGSGENRRFECDIVPGEPKILTAIKKLINVTQGGLPYQTKASLLTSEQPRCPVDADSADTETHPASE